MSIHEELKARILDLLRDKDILQEKVVIRARTLTPEEAIGHPEGQDFPLQKGKERLMQAEFRGAFGQAFTDRFGDFEGPLEQVFNLPMENNYHRAVFIAAVNAVLSHLGLVRGTVHCRDEAPKECSAELADYIRDRYGKVNVLQVGFQPRMVESNSAVFPYRLLDLDRDNIGTRKFGVLVEDPEATDEAVEWADLLLVTGTTVVNDTIDRFLTPKPVIFYGTTIAGAAHLMGWERFCARSE